MRIRTSLQVLTGGMLLLLTTTVATDAQSNTTTVVSSPTVNRAATNAPAQMNAPDDLSRGTTDIIKLFRAGKKDNVLIFYVNNAGLEYKLSADDIIYLKAIGISKDVITAMMDSDKDRQKSVIVQAELERPIFAPEVPTVTTPEAAPPIAVQQPTPVAEDQVQSAPTVIYPDYSAYPDYYQSFDNASQGHTHVAVSVGIGFGSTGFYHGYAGHGGHFGGRH